MLPNVVPLYQPRFHLQFSSSCEGTPQGWNLPVDFCYPVRFWGEVRSRITSNTGVGHVHMPPVIYAHGNLCNFDSFSSSVLSETLDAHDAAPFSSILLLVKKIRTVIDGCMLSPTFTDHPFARVSPLWMMMPLEVGKFRIPSNNNIDSKAKVTAHSPEGIPLSFLVD